MVYKNKNKTNVEGWEEQMGKFPSKPSFFPIFSPIWGEKKNTSKWWAQGKHILSLPKSTPQPNKVAIQISPYFPLPFFILP